MTKLIKTKKRHLSGIKLKPKKKKKQKNKKRPNRSFGRALLSYKEFCYFNKQQTEKS